MARKAKESDPWSSASIREQKFWPMDLFTRAIVLMVANKLGVFECLAGGPVALEEIVKTLKTDPKGTRILLDALTALKYLKKSGGLYANESDTMRFLAKPSHQYIGTMLLHSYQGLGRWLRLEDLIRKGQEHKHKLPEFQDSPAEERRRRKEFTLGLNESSISTAKLAARMLDLKDVKELLDLGGGAGIYSICFAKRWPSLKSVIFEMPVPAKIARSQVKRAGLKRRISVKTGNFLKDDLGKETYDAVFMSNIIHNFGPENNLKIISKAHRALRSGGRIFIKDMILREGRGGPYYPVMFALTMLMATEEGDTYERSQVTQWLRDAGFDRIRQQVVIPHESSVIIGCKK